MAYTNGEKYVGAWAKGQKYGFGTMTYRDGTVYEGLWEKDEPLKSNQSK